MGYGLDYIWPKIAEKWKFNIGIVDATPVDHSYRPQGKTYVSSENILKMQELFENFDNNERDKKISYQYLRINFRGICAILYPDYLSTPYKSAPQKSARHRQYYLGKNTHNTVISV